MDKSFIVCSVSLDVFEGFIQRNYGEIKVDNGENSFSVGLNSTILNEYYDTFYISQITNNSIVDDKDFDINIAIDVVSKKVLTVSEARENNIFSYINTQTVFFNLFDGSGEQELEILNIDRSLIEISIMNDVDLKLNISFGFINLSVEYISKVLLKKELKNIEIFPFLVKKDLSIFGILKEPTIEEDSKLYVVQI